MVSARASACGSWERPVVGARVGVPVALAGDVGQELQVCVCVCACVRACVCVCVRA